MRRTLTALALVIGLLVSGCGGNTGATSSTTATKSGYPPGPTRQFIVPGGDNTIQFFGREGTTTEREQASRTIEGWMRARALQAWRKDCSYFSQGYRKNITSDAHGVTQGKVQNCPQALAHFGHAASGDYVNNLSGPIDSLRVGVIKAQRHQGYAQYHGNDGKDWIVPMEKEGGDWKVAIATPIERNK